MLYNSLNSGGDKDSLISRERVADEDRASKIMGIHNNEVNDSHRPSTCKILKPSQRNYKPLQHREEHREAEELKNDD